MGYRFNPGWEPNSEPEITQEMAQEFLSKLFKSQAPTPPPIFIPPPPPVTPHSVQAMHFGGYIEDMMFGEGYNTINITIQKADEENLIFKINHKEK